MKALILNSGLGSRMGVLTSEHPKCMTEISPRETILSRQLRQLAEADAAWNEEGYWAVPYVEEGTYFPLQK